MMVSRLLPLAVAVAVGVALLPTTSARALETIEVRTVPAARGLALAVDGQRVVTDVAGKASAVVSDADTVDIRLPRRRARVGPGTRAQIGSVTRTGQEWTVRLSLEYLVGFRFVTVDGETVSNDTIERINLRSSSGRIKRIKPIGRVWLHGLRVTQLDGSPTPKVVWWSIDDVLVRNTTVVNRSQQRFEPANISARDRTFDVELLFFDVTVRARDAFFGSPVNGELIVEAPDGTVERYALDASGAVNLGDVPRGQYQMTVEGHGLRLSRPVTITRDIDDELRFYSWLDVGLATASVALFLYGLWAIGAARHKSRRHAQIDPLTEGAR